MVGGGGGPARRGGGWGAGRGRGVGCANGRWDVENRGVPADVEVEFEPKAAREGRDPQLEKAVEIVLAKLKESPPTKVERPPFPNYYKADVKEPAEGK